jgi:hypothetical protein
MNTSPQSSPDRSELSRFLTSQVAARLKCPVEEVSPDSDLMRLSLQSIDAVIINGDLEDYTKREVDPTLLLRLPHDHPNC